MSYLPVKRNYIKILCVVGASFGFVWFLTTALENSRLAWERERIRQELYVNRLSDEWLQGEIERLTSGRTSWVYFYSTGNTDALVKRLAGMPEIHSLTFETTDLSDTGVESIATIPNLEKLTIHGGAVGDEGIKTLLQVDRLKTLHVINLDLTDDGLAALQFLRNLETLTVYCNKRSKNKLTDAAIQHLSKLKKLTKLNVGGGWLSMKTLSELKNALTDCIITENYADNEW